LRDLMRNFWPGLYIPAIPSKKMVGNKDVKFILERRYFLERFVMQMS
jgi:PX domain